MVARAAATGPWPGRAPASARRASCQAAHAAASCVTHSVTLCVMFLLLGCHGGDPRAEERREMHTLLSEGERALERGAELAGYGRPACEKRPWFTCVEGKGSSDQGHVYLNDAVQILSALHASDPGNARVGRALAEAHIQSWNFSAAMHVLEPLLQSDGDQSPFMQLMLRETLMRVHIMSTRGGRLRDASRAQAEILRQFLVANATFAAMHFVEIPMVTGVMARENMLRLHNQALQALPPPSQRPPMATMKQIFSSLVLRKQKIFTVGYVSGKGFQRYSTTEALLATFWIRRQMPWSGPNGRHMRSICYAPLPDDGSSEREMMSQVCELVEADGMTSQQLAHRIQADTVHVLIDLHGYTLGPTPTWAQVMHCLQIDKGLFVGHIGLFTGHAAAERPGAGSLPRTAADHGERARAVVHF